MSEENTFGIFLRKYREERQLSTNDLHKITGVSQPYLSQIENGKKPSRKTISKIAAGLTKNNQSEFGNLYKELLSNAGYSTDWKFIDEVEVLYKDKIEETKDTIALIEHVEQAFEEGNPIPVFVDQQNNVNIIIYRGTEILNNQDTEILNAMIKGFLFGKKFIDYRENQ